MAKNKSTVYLGYDEEEITAKHIGMLNSNVNKIGGVADWPSGEIKVPPCPLCGTARPLIVQMYAPLEQSQFHRTLYVFGCLNPACSQHSKSWQCVRTQHLDTPMAELKSAAVQPSGNKKKNKKQPPKQKANWCSGADDWGEAVSFEKAVVVDTSEKMDTAADDEDELQLQQQNEQNGNVMTVSKNDNSPTTLPTRLQVSVSASLELPAAENAFVDDVEDDDDDDDSNSMENDFIGGFGQLEISSPQQEEDPNANGGVGMAAAAAAAPVDVACFGGSATATIGAEIEGAETDVVFVETPQKPERDLIALLKHTTTPVALGPLAKLSDVQLKPFFIAVDVEQRHSDGGVGEYENYGGALSADHIRELYQEYKRQDEAAHSPNGCGAVGGAVGGAAGGAAGDEQESYEKSVPAHGDLIFHQFISAVQQNPGQILRYSRDTLPLLIAPLGEPVPKCQNCNGETLCEVQILSTLIPKLRLQQNSEPAPIEYGNVLIFTCLKSCWDTPDKMRYEHVIVQAQK